jgi:hypothetical protein
MPVDWSLYTRTLLSASVAQVFHLANTRSSWNLWPAIFASTLEKDDNRSKTHSRVIITARTDSFVMQIYATWAFFRTSVLARTPATQRISSCRSTNFSALYVFYYTYKTFRLNCYRLRRFLFYSSPYIVLSTIITFLSLLVANTTLWL